MGRFHGGYSANHWVHKAGREGDDYETGWTVDYYYASSRLRFPRCFRRTTDRAGALRFAKKWDLDATEL